MLDPSDVVFTGPFEREARVSADRRTITHRAMAWSMDYTPNELIKWIGFYERMVDRRDTPQFRADVEVLHKARDLMAQEGGLP